MKEEERGRKRKRREGDGCTCLERGEGAEKICVLVEDWISCQDPLEESCCIMLLSTFKEEKGKLKLDKNKRTPARRERK